MKKIFKFIKQNIIGLIVGGIVFGSIGVYAVVVITSKEITYEDNTSIGATNVQDAIDKLNTKATTKIKEAEAKCPEGKVCRDAVCKRATILHTEICSNTYTSSHCSGDGYTASGSMGTTIITYGNLGTTGVLTTGDAFDCDVNGDGVYDSATERFYYVSDMTNGITTDTNTAVLIYYNNVSGGVASSSTAYAYDESGSNNNGPVTAIKQLPTTSQWKNVSLTNTTRSITNENGGNTTDAGNLPTAFSYEGYAARLLTAQEVSTGCGFTVGSYYTVGKLSSKCKYLMENTTYYSTSSSKTIGGWLESPSAYYSDYAWGVQDSGRTVKSDYVNDAGDYGVRPAIEVLKSNISY